jgi:hypothetical protein
MAKTKWGPDLRELRRSRRKLRAGDLFDLSPEGRGWWFGRVINSDEEPAEAT